MPSASPYVAAFIIQLYTPIKYIVSRLSEGSAYRMGAVLLTQVVALAVRGLWLSIGEARGGCSIGGHWTMLEASAQVRCLDGCADYWPGVPGQPRAFTNRLRKGANWWSVMDVSVCPPKTAPAIHMIYLNYQWISWSYTSFKLTIYSSFAFWSANSIYKFLKGSRMIKDLGDAAVVSTPNLNSSHHWKESEWDIDRVSTLNAG